MGVGGQRHALVVLLTPFLSGKRAWASVDGCGEQKKSRINPQNIC
jgi:hypothetical protein